MAALVLVLLITLHRSDGGEVTVAAGQITSLRSPAGRLNELAPHARCIVWMTDGRFVGVLESCAEIRRVLQDKD